MRKVAIFGPGTFDPGPNIVTFPMVPTLSSFSSGYFTKNNHAEHVYIGTTKYSTFLYNHSRPIQMQEKKITYISGSLFCFGFCLGLVFVLS